MDTTMVTMLENLFRADDPFFYYELGVHRLLREYRTHGKLIIAFDFDDTVFDTHTRGWTYEAVVQLLRAFRPYAYFICWSASKPDRYPMMREHFEQHDIPCDAINENAPGIEERGRKIYANVYIDNRAGLYETCCRLTAVLRKIKEGENNDGHNENDT